MRDGELWPQVENIRTRLNSGCSRSLALTSLRSKLAKPHNAPMVAISARKREHETTMR
jgi:hypothetical protein